MRWAKLVVTTLVVAATLQPLAGQATKPPFNNADTSKTSTFDEARASGFDFAQVLARTLEERNRALPNLSANRPLDSKVIVLDPKSARQLANESVCFTLHVFQFSQKDGEPPHLVGSTTCTPAQRVNPREAEGADESGRKMKYVPRLFHPL